MGKFDSTTADVNRIRRNRSVVGQVVDETMFCAAGWNRAAIGPGWFEIRKNRE